MKNATHRVPALATAAIVLSGALAAAIGSSSAPAQNNHALAAQTLHLVVKGGDLKVVDNPPKARHQYDFSAGDIVIVTRDVTTARAGRVGWLRLVCIATGATTPRSSAAPAPTPAHTERASPATERPTPTSPTRRSRFSPEPPRQPSSQRFRRYRKEPAMHRIPAWALITIGAVLAALSISGLVFSVHTSARIVYATLLLVSLAGIANGYQRRKT